MYLYSFTVATSPSIASTPVVTTGATNSGPTSLAPAALRELYGNATAGPGHPLASLVSQQRFLELSRFGLRHYDLAQHMLTQQGAVTKLLGEFSFTYISTKTGSHLPEIPPF